MSSHLEAKRSTSCSIDRIALEAMQRSRRTSGEATNKVDCDREKSRSARACASGTDSFWTCGEIVSGLAMMNRIFLFVVVGPWERFRALPWPALSRLPPESLLRRRPPCCCEEQEHCGGIEQQRDRQDEPAHDVLVGGADECRQIPDGPEVGLGLPALAIGRGLLDL